MKQGSEDKEEQHNSIRGTETLPKKNSTASANNKTFFSMDLTAHSGPRPLIQFRNHLFTDE
jgi:hypothetical protein